MNFVKYILVLGVMFVRSDAGGHGESHDHVKLHVPEFIEHDHHTKVITIHHHHHKPKKEHHHHHHHHHKPHIIPYGPPKYHHTHHHSKSSSHTVSKGHTSIGKKSHGLHGTHGHHGKHHSGHHSHSDHDGHHNYKHHDIPASYDPPSTNYDPPTVNYASPSINYSPSPSFGNDYGSFLPSVPNVPSPQIHGVVHTVQQVKLFDSLHGPLKTGSTGYQVTEQGDEGEEDVFTSVNSLSESYPGTFEHVRSAAEQGDHFSDITHSNSDQSPNGNPFSNAQPQLSYANLEDFKIQSQSAPYTLSGQPSYSEVRGYDNGDNSVMGNDLSSGSHLSFAEAVQDDTPVSFSREAGLQHAINTGGIETVAY